MNPYVYPKAIHVRRFKPGPFTRYQPYKPYLRDEFSKKCVYCRRPDGPSGEASFSVDHYLPKRLNPLLSATYTNLFYCCRACNTWKGEYQPDSSDKRAKRFVPNPCDHVMFQHLRFRGAVVEPHSEAGRKALELLHLNDPDETEYRAALITMLEELTRIERECKTTISALMALKINATPEVGADITENVVKVTGRLRDVQNALARFGLT